MMHELNFQGDEGFPFTCLDNKVHFDKPIDSGKVYYLWLADMVLTRKADLRVFEPVSLLRPINVYIPSSGPDVKLLDIATGISELYRMSALDSNRGPIPHAKLGLFDPARDNMTQFSADLCGQVLMAENPTVFTSQIPPGCGLLIENIGATRGEPSGRS